MKKQIAKLMVAVAFAGVVVAGTITSCDDSNDNNAVGTGTGGSTGSGGAGGANPMTFNMTLTGRRRCRHDQHRHGQRAGDAQPDDRATSPVSGTFTGLTSDATAAHIHGPAAVGANAPVIVPLTVPAMAPAPSPARAA
jgi:hypothetical protein